MDQRSGQISQSIEICIYDVAYPQKFDFSICGPKFVYFVILFCIYSQYTGVDFDFGLWTGLWTGLVWTIFYSFALRFSLISDNYS